MKHANFLNKILADIKRIISHDHVRIIPRIQGWFSIRKAINISHTINRIKENHMIISIDVKKAFAHLTKLNIIQFLKPQQTRIRKEHVQSAKGILKK